MPKQDSSISASYFESEILRDDQALYSEEDRGYAKNYGNGSVKSLCRGKSQIIGSPFLTHHNLELLIISKQVTFCKQIREAETEVYAWQVRMV